MTPDLNRRRLLLGGLAVGAAGLAPALSPAPPRAPGRW